MVKVTLRKPPHSKPNYSEGTRQTAYDYVVILASGWIKCGYDTDDVWDYYPPNRVVEVKGEPQSNYAENGVQTESPHGRI